MSDMSRMRKCELATFAGLLCDLAVVLIFTISGPPFVPPGPEGDTSLLAECPYCHRRDQFSRGGVSCTCGKTFVVAPCLCQAGHAAVGIQERGWYCPGSRKWFWARLCPQCRLLATSYNDLCWQCAKGHAKFRIGLCQKCNWFAGEHPDGYLVCESCGYHTTAKGR